MEPCLFRKMKIRKKNGAMTHHVDSGIEGTEEATMTIRRPAPFFCYQ